MQLETSNRPFPSSISNPAIPNFPGEENLSLTIIARELLSRLPISVSSRFSEHRRLPSPQHSQETSHMHSTTDYLILPLSTPLYFITAPNDEDLYTSHLPITALARLAISPNPRVPTLSYRITSNHPPQHSPPLAHSVPSRYHACREYPQSHPFQGFRRRSISISSS